MRKLILILILCGAGPATQPIKPKTQTEFLLAIMDNNYKAHIAFEKGDWKAAVEASDRIAILVQDAIVAEAANNRVETVAVK